MKIESLKLVYFSPTGTTEKIVKSIAGRINCGITEAVDITGPKERERRLRTSESELLIIGVPVYFGRVQAIAIDWLKTIEAHNTPAVCVVVYGNRAYDDALLELKDAVIKRGGLPVACASFIGEHSFSSSDAPIAAGRPGADDLLCAESFGEKIMERILSLPSVDYISDISVPGRYPYVNMEESRKRLAAVDLAAVDDKCLQCGECAKICPTGAIDAESSSSTDTTKCILCHACIKGCPANARRVKSDMINGIAMSLSRACRERKEPEFFIG